MKWNKRIYSPFCFSPQLCVKGQKPEHVSGESRMKTNVAARMFTTITERPSNLFYFYFPTGVSQRDQIAML